MFQQNIVIIEQRWPYLAEQISRAQMPAQVELVSAAPETTLVVDGIQLSSRYDRLREARLQASLVPAGSEIVHVYGLATGDLPRVLLDRKELKKLHVVVLSLAVARASLTYLEHSDWLDDPRVNLLTASSSSDLQLPFACASASLSLADNSGARMRDLLYLELATPYIGLQQASLRPAQEELIARNAEFIKQDESISSLFLSQRGKEVFIAAAGPTLPDSYQWLAAQRERFFLIAVDASVMPLAQAGFIPDLVISVDSAPQLFNLFFGEIKLSDFADVSLVYFPAVDNRLLEQWPGRRFLAFSQDKLYSDLAQKYPQGDLFSSGSVLHSATDLAVKMGAARIYFAGADFSFPKGQSHVEGCAAHIDVGNAGLVSYWVLNGRGERVPSSQNFRGYLRDLERYLAWHPEVKFINCSSEGAKIEGTHLLERGH